MEGKGEDLKRSARLQGDGGTLVYCGISQLHRELVLADV